MAQAVAPRSRKRPARIALAFLAVLAALSAHAVDRDAVAERSVRGVIERTSPDLAKRLDVEVVPDLAHPLRYRWEARGGRLKVRGASGIAACRAVYDYIRGPLHGMVTWAGTHVPVPSRLPDAAPVQVDTTYQFFLQDNVCTFGYTTAYFGWKEWQRYLDVMALHGVNMQFAPLGSEAIWQRVWRSFGCTDAQIDAMVTGPAHLPWNRMGNLYKHDGPLTADYHAQAIALEKQILARMRELGITPVPPAFAGFVPPGFEKVVGGSADSVITMAPWAGFDGDTASHILSPESPLYQEIGKRYIREWKKEFGPAKYFLADSFNEMEVPVPSDRNARLETLRRYGKAVYSSIEAGDPDAVWVMQGWLFYNARAFWDPESVEALLSGVPNDKMLILDLFAEGTAIYKIQNAFYGKPWMLSTITNWGGRTSFGGNLTKYAGLSASAQNDPKRGKLVGIGISHEGAEANEVMAELIADSAFRTTPIDLNQWLGEWVHSRYGVASKSALDAWQGFERERYRWVPGTGPIHLLQQRPHDLGPARNSPFANTPRFVAALESLLAAEKKCKASPLYQVDAIEVVSQFALEHVDQDLEAAALHANLEQVEEARKYLANARDIVTQVDALMSQHPLHRLDRWVSLARGWGQDAASKDRYEANAKRLVTTWGGPVLTEYAARVWSGLLRSYYLPRWEQWIEAKCSGNDSFDIEPWEEKWVTTPWSGAAPVLKVSPASVFRYVKTNALAVGDLSKLGGTTIGGWKSGETSEVWAVREWPLSTGVSPGKWRITFLYTKGGHRLDIDGVELVAGDRVIAADRHQGRTGIEHVKNVFRLDVPELPKDGPLVLRARIRSDGGSDSNGNISLLIVPRKGQ